MNKLIYTKYSTDRDKNFAIRTDRLLADDGEEIIRKAPLFEECKAHLEHMVAMSKKLQDRFGEEIKVTSSSFDEEGLTNEFVTGEPYYNIFEELLDKGDKDDIMDALNMYRDKIFYSTKEPVSFQLTSEFLEVFGDHEELEDASLLSDDVTDIDMILENIIVSESGTWQLIDYEWTFDFPVPREYVIYRALVYLYNNSKIVYFLTWEQALEWAGITASLENAFMNMEKHFQAYISGGKKRLEEYLEESGIGITLLSELAMANDYHSKELAKLQTEYKKLQEKYNEVSNNYGLLKEFKKMADENSMYYNELKDAYVVQQVSLDEYRKKALREAEINSQKGLKNFVKRSLPTRRKQGE